jgi:hypothetical protein
VISQQVEFWKAEFTALIHFVYELHLLEALIASVSLHMPF